MRAALVDEKGIVVNILMADSEKDSPPEGFYFIKLREDDPIDNSGWIYDPEEKVFIKKIKASE